jgi:septal ring factor EnvC (AmiA/AmiB activator)
LPSCPNCGTAIASPTRVFSVIVEPKEGERGLTQRKVGMYTCTSCGLKFPTVVSRQRYLIVGEDQLKQIQADVKTLKKENGELQKKVVSVEKEYANIQDALETTRKESEVKQLQTRLYELEEQVGYLRKEKRELDEKVSKLS